MDKTTDDREVFSPPDAYDLFEALPKCPQCGARVYRLTRDHQETILVRWQCESSMVWSDSRSPYDSDFPGHWRTDLSCAKDE